MRDHAHEKVSRKTAVPLNINPQTVHTDVMKCLFDSSPIQTLLSVPDSHWVNRLTRVTDFDYHIVTVGREFHPAPKKSIQFSKL